MHYKDGLSSYSPLYLHLLAGDIYVFFTEVNNEFVYPRISIGVEKKRNS